MIIENPRLVTICYSPLITCDLVNMKPPFRICSVNDLDLIVGKQWLVTFRYSSWVDIQSWIIHESFENILISPYQLSYSYWNNSIQKNVADQKWNEKMNGSQLPHVLMKWFKAKVKWSSKTHGWSRSVIPHLSHVT
jgi:hypothetical protein